MIGQGALHTPVADRERDGSTGERDFRASSDERRRREPPAGPSAEKDEAGDDLSTIAGVDECWWRWGRLELPVQNTFPENFLQVFPANLRFALRAPDRRGASLAIR
jgi:hypothetical protein